MQPLLMSGDLKVELFFLLFSPQFNSGVPGVGVTAGLGVVEGDMRRDGEGLQSIRPALLNDKTDSMYT